MNWDQIAGNWKKFSGAAREQWGKLTEDDVQRIRGNREQLSGTLQERYGYARDKVEEEIEAWTQSRRV